MLLLYYILYYIILYIYCILTLYVVIIIIIYICIKYKNNDFTSLYQMQTMNFVISKLLINHHIVSNNYLFK